MSQVGISVVTCDRPVLLKSLLRSFSKERHNCIGVVVDNGSPENVDEVLKIATLYGFHYIHGNRTNSPHGQNLGFYYLAQEGCYAVVKCDDDIRLNHNCLLNLSKKFNELSNVGAVGAATWTNTTNTKIRKVADGYKTVNGADVSGECIMMYRHCRSSVIPMRHLHGVFIYSVPAALELAQKTLGLRGGAFGEYFSHVAHREETEFTYLLREVVGKQLYFVTDAIVFHHSAPGGVRNYDYDNLVSEDNKKVEEVMKTLDIQWELNPAWM